MTDAISPTAESLSCWTSASCVVLELMERRVQVGGALLDDGLGVAMASLDRLDRDRDDEGDEQAHDEQDPRPRGCKARDEGGACVRNEGPASRRRSCTGACADGLASGSASVEAMSKLEGMGGPGPYRATLRLLKAGPIAVAMLMCAGIMNSS